MNCLICNKKTTTQYVYDIDLAGFPYCKEHDFSVYMYVILLVVNGEHSAKSWLKAATKPKTKKMSAKKKK